MEALSLAELAEAATTATEPSLTSSYIPRFGTINPLGLSQTNFDLMDQVFPGLNNVAVHIRPFTLVTWAWKRAAVCADKFGMDTISSERLQDFVDRLEVVYVWSQFLRPVRVELPGRDVLGPLVAGTEYTFGGTEWQQRRKVRKDSTGLSAALNYGPALRALGWLRPHPKYRGIFTPEPVAEAAITAFEKEMEPHLGHPVFSRFGEVSVAKVEVQQWSEAWALERPTQQERNAMMETLGGESANHYRRNGMRLTVAAVQHLSGATDSDAVRSAMCGSPTSFVAAASLEQVARTWRILQWRQVFRLALEAFLHWLLLKLAGEPMTSGALVSAFLASAGTSEMTGSWLSEVRDSQLGPTVWLQRLQASLASVGRESGLPSEIRGALATSIHEGGELHGPEQDDRLPMARAAKEAVAFNYDRPEAFLTRVLESWVIGQHTHSSVMRGIGDARAGRRMILRLRIALDEGGWTRTPRSPNRPPEATADRLETVLSLLRAALVI
jgi:hypothetical protein